jgi:prepilin-type N-terminal cleavage/methylation domain-containing protein
MGARRRLRRAHPAETPLGFASLRARLRRAFTLLEVLVAVAVLTLVYVALAGVAMQGLRAEGDADRRLRASLLADSKLSEVEAQMDLGEGRPEPSETEEDPFLVTVEIEPYELVLPEDPTQQGKAPTAPAPSLLRAGGPGNASALLQVRVSVAWVEGANEQVVSRVTWGIDREVAGQLISSVAPQLLEGGEREAEGQDATDGDDLGREPAAREPTAREAAREQRRRESRGRETSEESR